MRTTYTRGREVEYLARDRLRSRGYQVIRSAGSQSPVDLVTWQEQGHPLLVQVRRIRTPAGNPGDVARRYHDDLEGLRRIKKPYRAGVQLWVWTHREGWRIFDVMAGGICEVTADVA